MEKILKVQSLSKKFGAIVASDNINFDLNANEIHALIGPNGAGKSTLVKQIVGEIKQNSGEIWLGRQELSKLNTPDRINMGLARTFQVTNIVPDFSVIENVMIPVIGQNKIENNFVSSKKMQLKLKNISRSFLANTELLDKEDVLASSLSHGERRQLELCLALALEPKVILLDEPMAGLSLDAIEMTKENLKKIKLMAPILLIEHDMDVVFSLADRISVLVYGKIIATGSPLEIRKNVEVQRAYLGV